MASGQNSVPRSPIGEPPPIIRGKPGEPDSIEAHRTRELKWMSLISQVPASQARKNKKIKKLIMEGVPSSVRYLVWAHLTDSKARGMPGIYVQLGKRERVQAFQAIERDAQKCYPDQPQLQTSQGTLVALLQSYLTMVPDIHYETAGLAYIAGRLLILAPDEDAFWIFTSLMDLYLRPWFSVNTSQMEVDGSLFSKALEANDPPVSKKLYVDLGISQTAVCRPWLSSLFAESLPVEYLHRIWDIFLYEGVPFLFRIGMAIVHCCRHYMLSSTSEAAALEVLVHPPAACLPPNPEVFITLANSFKLKDDDVRKQRIKMEAQVKRQTQIRTVSTPGAPISLPKA
ncbi:RabGAP/TBC [Athelia psychrophila]|uniref:RabGAP/TBC n=1 Tax=Athelia psychrophila TaxID=1759441 RepID=A0A166KDI1_9AGAM|nr:RabGAP/TBC [Fibularhizoctonia sp. CBS 109695]